ncbi:MAG: hypothetical protein EXS35_10225 [Pedosphaera sp.]|nr:hypothetical protein [Pedosphaera sp.]
MKLIILILSASLAFASVACADENLDAFKLELEGLKHRVTALEEENRKLKTEVVVDRLIVRKELIVSDTGQKWEKGFEAQQIPRGVYARSLWDGPGGLWVRSRLIKGEIDDPFDDRFHALEKDGSVRGAPGHISWNEWIDGAWRQMAIIQGEGLEPSEIPPKELTGGNHPGRLRFQTFRPHHDEPLTDALIGQGMMSLGGGGYGGGGLPYPSEVLQLWGGEVRSVAIPTPERPTILSDDGSDEHDYAVIAVGVQGKRTPASPTARAKGLARLRWDSVAGGDAYVIVRDGKEIAGPLRL